MLTTYGTRSFGTVIGTGAHTPGFFPRREIARAKHTKLAEQVAKTVLSGKSLRIGTWQRRMFKVMKRKITGVHVINYMQNGTVEGQPDPPKMMVKMVRKLIEKRGVSDEQVSKIAGLMSFELGWWRSREWLGARTFRQLAAQPVPAGFDARAHLL